LVNIRRSYAFFQSKILRGFNGPKSFMTHYVYVYSYRLTCDHCSRAVEFSYNILVLITPFNMKGSCVQNL